MKNIVSGSVCHTPLKSCILYLWLILVGYLPLSCGGGGATGEQINIPQDVSFVFSVNFKSLSDKAENPQQVINNLLQSMNAGDIQEFSNKVLTEGLDLQKKGYFFGSSDREKKGD
ncbi:MAG: DUF4836 family protein [Bacteroidia bacterium]|nr:DUF4836 family protein [Bacteroidia bacterium]